MNLRTTTIISIITAGILVRLLPHAPNFSPIAAIALFSGAHFTSKLFKFLVPITVLFHSYFFLGFYSLPGMIAVYISFGIIITLGSLLANNNIIKTGICAVLGSVIFVLITNFAFFYPATMYPHNFKGILASYVAAAPFFQNALFGDLFYNNILFGGFYLLTQKVKLLKTA